MEASTSLFQDQQTNIWNVDSQKQNEFEMSQSAINVIKYNSFGVSGLEIEQCQPYAQIASDFPNSWSIGENFNSNKIETDIERKNLSINGVEMSNTGTNYLMTHSLSDIKMGLNQNEHISNHHNNSNYSCDSHSSGSNIIPNNMLQNDNLSRFETVATLHNNTTPFNYSTCSNIPNSLILTSNSSLSSGSGNTLQQTLPKPIHLSLPARQFNEREIFQNGVDLSVDSNIYGNGNISFSTPIYDNDPQFTTAVPIIPKTQTTPLLPLYSNASLIFTPQPLSTCHSSISCNCLHNKGNVSNANLLNEQNKHSEKRQGEKDPLSCCVVICRNRLYESGASLSHCNCQGCCVPAPQNF